MSLVISRGIVLQPSPSTPSPNAPLVGWRSFVAFDSVSADFEDEDYPVVNLANESTILEWRSTTTDTQYVYVDIPEGEYADYMALAAHNLSGATLTIEALNSEAGWDVIMESFLPATDDPVIARFVPSYTSQIRLKIEGASLIPSIAVMYAGPLMLLPRNIYVGHTPINYARQTEVANGVAESGDFLGRIVMRRSKATGLEMGNIPPDWFRTDFEPFMTHAVEFPFFFAWRPRDYPLEVGYVWATGDIEPNNQLNNGFMQFNMSFAGIAGRAGVPMVPRDKRWVLENGYWSSIGYWRTDLTW